MGNPQPTTTYIDVTNYSKAKITVHYSLKNPNNISGVSMPLPPAINGTYTSNGGVYTIDCENLTTITLYSGYTAGSWEAFVLSCFSIELTN